jgi:hypothetical protein
MGSLKAPGNENGDTFPGKLRYEAGSLSRFDTITRRLYFYAAGAQPDKEQS